MQDVAHVARVHVAGCSPVTAWFEANRQAEAAPTLSSLKTKLCHWKAGGLPEIAP